MSAESNLCVVLKSARELKLEERSIPTPERGEVLLAMRSVGICGSDVHYWQEGRIGDFIMKEPMVLGHESSGIVIARGKDVIDLEVGDRVAIEPGVPCRICSFCREGRYNLCPEMKFSAAPPTDGSLAKFYVHAADFCHKLPDHVSFDEGALLEPLSVGVHACQRAGVKLGSKVLVCGAGSIGLSCLLVAKACGASEVIVTDLDEHRLHTAKKLGATYTLKVTTKNSRASARQIVDTLGCNPDKSIECSGAGSSLATAIYATLSGGVLVLVGIGAPEVKLPIVDASVREVDIRGIARYANCYPTALEMVASGNVNVSPLITHTYKLEESLQAFERAKTREGNAIKVIIRCGKE